MNKLIALAAVLALAGCPKKHTAKVVDPGDDTHSVSRDDADDDDDANDTGGTKTTVTGDDGSAMPKFAAIYFEFDSSTLTDESRTELQSLADWLDKHAQAQITIAGNTDDRGTDEYNIALGQRRADAIKEYLARLGVDDARLDTISYGEEMPAAQGADEKAWSKNRRGDLVSNR
jgi:peptidoglycan-associated lipoprotein